MFLSNLAPLCFVITFPAVTDGTMHPSGVGEAKVEESQKGATEERSKVQELEKACGS